MVLVIIGATLAAGGGVYLYSTRQSRLDQSTREIKEREEKTVMLGQEKQELDRRINELEAQLLSVMAPSSSPSAEPVPVKEKSENLEKLKAEIEALKKQKTTVVERIVVETQAPIPAPIQTQQPSPISSLLSKADIIRKIKPSVVYIESGTDANVKGSGFIIDANGYILTNAHVLVVGPISVKLPDGKTAKTIAFAKDEKADIAVLKVGGSFTPVTLGDSNTLEIGDDVYAFGYPFGFSGDVSFKEGTYSRNTEYEGITYIESSVDFHPGNSGGPLVDTSGNVIGINTAIYGSTIGGVSVGETLKLTIPINTVKKLLANLKISAVASKAYSEQDLFAYSDFYSALEKNVTLVQKGVGEYEKFATQLNLLHFEEAHTHVMQALDIFILARSAAKNLENGYPKNLPFSGTIKGVAASHYAWTSHLYDAAEYGKSYLTGYSDRGVRMDTTAGMAISIDQAIKAEGEFIKAFEEMENRAKAFFN